MDQWRGRSGSWRRGLRSDDHTFMEAARGAALSRVLNPPDCVGKLGLAMALKY